jgi:hypothetical protein
LLYVAIMLGVFMALASFVMAGWVIQSKLRHPELPVAGWPSVATAVFFTAGVTNIMLGLIGVYLGELFNWSKGRPRYLIGQTAGGAKRPDATTGLETQARFASCAETDAARMRASVASR